MTCVNMNNLLAILLRVSSLTFLSLGQKTIIDFIKC